MSISQKIRNVNFSEIKAPQGATRHKGAFENSPQENKFIVMIKSNNDFFKKTLKLDGNLPIKLTFLRKPKWSVWSIGAFSTTQN